MTEDDGAEEFYSTPNQAELEALEKLVTQAVVLQQQIDQYEKKIEDKRKELRVLVEKNIPDQLASAGVSRFTTNSGITVSIKESIVGALPKEDLEKRKAALEWLMENDGAHIIKGQIVVPFAKGDHNFKNEVKHLLEDIDADFIEAEDVHPSTLKAFAREKIRNGEELPLSLLGLNALRMAEIKTK